VEFSTEGYDVLVYAMHKTQLVENLVQASYKFSPVCFQAPHTNKLFTSVVLGRNILNGQNFTARLGL
jgi:hypothetical protein